MSSNDFYRQEFPGSDFGGFWEAFPIVPVRDTIPFQLSPSLQTSPPGLSDQDNENHQERGTRVRLGKLVRLPGLANKNVGFPVKIELQINNKSFFNRSVFHAIFVTVLSCILSDNLSSEIISLFLFSLIGHLRHQFRSIFSHLWFSASQSIEIFSRGLCRCLFFVLT